MDRRKIKMKKRNQATTGKSEKEGTKMKVQKCRIEETKLRKWRKTMKQQLKHVFKKNEETTIEKRNKMMTSNKAKTELSKKEWK